MKQILNIIKKADKLEGDFVSIGCGYCEREKDILLAMAADEVTRRKWIILDNFEKTPPQRAYDFINDVVNYIERGCKLAKADIHEDFTEEFEGQAALVHYDIDNKDLTVIGISKMFDGLPQNAIIFTDPSNKKTKEGFEAYADKNKDARLVVESKDISYIIKKVIKPRKPKKVVREYNPNLT